MPTKATKPGEQLARWVNWGCTIVHDDSNTACKHGTSHCEVCGTTDYADVKHTTVGGKGLIARLRKKGGPP